VVDGQEDLVPARSVEVELVGDVRPVSHQEVEDGGREEIVVGGVRGAECPVGGTPLVDRDLLATAAGEVQDTAQALETPGGGIIGAET
jgi:hypothetical protein